MYDGNFLIIRWGILNLKLLFSLLKIKKWMFRRFVHFEVLRYNLQVSKYFSLTSTVTAKYFSTRRKILSPYGKSADSVSTFVFNRFSYGDKVVWGPGQRNPQEIGTYIITNSLQSNVKTSKQT
jgi:hypothetical protein